MNKVFAFGAVMALVATPLVAGPNGSLTGDYVEARMAEVLTGGCIMGSEAETIGKQAVLAWRVTEGTFDGVSLRGLSVVAAVAGDQNLGIHEIGGVAPTRVEAAVMVDERASTRQRQALMAMVRAMAAGLIDEIVDVQAVPISFSRDADRVAVSAGDAELDVATEISHSPDCGAMQWFHPLSTLPDAAVGLTKTQVYSGSALGTKWSQGESRSAFFGTFAY